MWPVSSLPTENVGRTMVAVSLRFSSGCRSKVDHSAFLGGHDNIFARNCVLRTLSIPS